MALLQQAANTSSLSPAPKHGSPGPVVNLGTSAAQDSLASALGDDLHLSLHTHHNAPTSPNPPAPQTSVPPTSTRDTLASYQPLSPTMSPLPSRTHSPAPSATSPSSRARAFSTASAGSASSRTAGLTRTQALAASGGAVGLLPSGGRHRSSSASPGSGTAAPEVTRLSIAGTVAGQENDPLMAFSPVAGHGEGGSKGGEGVWTVAPGSLGPSEASHGRGTAIAALQAVPGPASTLSPPRLPPRRNTVTESDIPMSCTRSNSSASSMAAPALPPRPRGVPIPSATLPPSLPSTAAHAPPALPSRSRTMGLGLLNSGNSTSSLASSTRSPAPTPPRRHLRPVAGSEFESVDLGHPASSSPALSLSSASFSSSLAPASPAWSRPPHLVRAGSYASSVASGSGSTPPHSPTAVRARSPAGGQAGRARRPVDPRARRRYDGLFDEATARGGGGGSGGAGSRNGKGKASEAGEERLDGLVVRRIWLRSRLEGAFLRAVWDACDGEGRGSLDREGFCTGMWTIDEELRGRRGEGR